MHSIAIPQRMLRTAINPTAFNSAIESGSLVSRPFPPPVFDRLQYANTEGEGLGDLVMCGYVR